MFISRWKNALLDSLLLAFCTVLTIPVLLLGLSPVWILGGIMLISFSWYLLKKRNKVEIAFALIVWPLLSLLIVAVFKNLVVIEPFAFVNLAVSIPGIIFYLFVSLSIIGAQIMIRKMPFFSEGFVTESE